MSHPPAPRCTWKENWAETRTHLLDWWNRSGFVVGSWAPPPWHPPRETMADPGLPADLRTRFVDADWRARSIHWGMARAWNGLDILPTAPLHLGPGSLAILLGSEPVFTPETVWYTAPWEHLENPEDTPPLRFDPENAWWKVHRDLLQCSRELAGDRYFVGIPDLIENLDILSSLRGPQTALYDLIERPEWVKAKLAEIHQVWREVYDRLYEIARGPDGDSVFWAFAVWGPGKAAKLQCDAAALISPAMFEEFIVPDLTAQCRHLDHSLYHLDGTQQLDKLDLLLAIPELDAIEFTMEPTVPSGGDPHWYDLYRRVVRAGKAVQAVNVKPEQVVPLVRALDGQGIYLLTDFSSREQAEDIGRALEQFR